MVRKYDRGDKEINKQLNRLNMGGIVIASLFLSSIPKKLP